MTFQPPPPPPPPGGQQPGSQPPAGAPQQGGWAPPPAPAGNPYPPARPAFDPKTVNQLDWGILGAGLLAFIFSFVSYYTVSVSYGGFGSASGSESAWHGFFGWFAALCAVAGSVFVAMELFAPHVRMPFPNRLIGLGLYAVATLCVILALFIFPEDVPDVKGVDTGRGFGYWISLIVIIAGLVLSLMRFQQGGGKLPGALGNIPNIGGHAPGGHSGPAGQPPQAPPPGYGPPPGPPPAP